MFSATCTPAANTVYVAGATFVNVTLQDCQTHCKTDPTCTFYTYTHTTRVCTVENLQGLTPWSCHLHGEPAPACFACCLRDLTRSMYDENARKLSWVSFWGGYKSTSIKHNHILFPPACTSLLKTEDLPAYPAAGVYFRWV